MMQATGIYIIIIVVAGTMLNIIMLALALRIICRRYTSVGPSDLGPGQLQAQGDVESPCLLVSKPTVVAQAGDQMEVSMKLTVEPLQLEGADLDAAGEIAADEQRHCWVVSVPLERRAKSVI